MRRRELLAALGAAAAWSISASAQQMREVGVLMTLAQDAEGVARLAAFQNGLRELGWREGTNIRLDVRWGAADPDKMRALAHELVAGRPDVILATSGRAVRLVEGEKRSVPIVFVGLVDPVGAGFVSNIARPGGNVTGFTSVETSFAAKWLQMLKEVAPAVKNVGFIYGHDNPSAPGFLQSLQNAAVLLDVHVISESVRTAFEVEAAVQTIARVPDAGLVLPFDATVGVHHELLTKLAVQYRLPALSGYPSFVGDGGLVSYGIDILDIHKRAASYVDRILKGEKPTNLPIQGPTKYSLGINLKAAKTLGLNVSPALLARADEVIE
jgi:putative ABC transport system substrate-binding protein